MRTYYVVTIDGIRKEKNTMTQERYDDLFDRGIVFEDLDDAVIFYSELVAEELKGWRK